MSKSISEYVEKINSKVDAVNCSTLELADLCVEAEAQLKTDTDREEMFPNLKLKPSMFGRYVKIGSNKFIRKYLESLPLNFSALYEAVCMTEAELKAGISEGVIHSSAPRRIIQNWISLRRGKSTSANDNQIVLHIVRPENFTEEQEGKLNSELKQVLERNGCKLKGTEAHTQAATERARGEYLRSTTRAHISAEKLRRQKEQQQKPKAKRTKAWPFTQEQVKVPGDATGKDCQQVLDLIGCGNAWQKILDEAHRLFGSSDEAETAPVKKTVKKKTAA